MAEELYAGLDIGSYAVRIAVGKVVPGPDGKGQIHIVGAVEVPSGGVAKGVITDIEEAVSSVSKALEQAERLTGLPVNAAWVGISGTQILAQESRGVIGVARPDGEIREEDVERSIEAARTVATPPNYEIIHVIPKSFIVDGQRGVKDPVAMHGTRLEVDTLIVQGLSSQIKNLTKCIYRTGLDIEDLVFSILATAEAVITARQKELGVCVVNLGSTTTSLAVFEEGDILHTAVLPVGSDHVTRDLAVGLRTSIDVAEQVKLRYATCLPQSVGKKERIDLAEFGVEGTELADRSFVAEITEARMGEIFEKIDAELAKVNRSGMLPAGIVLTGGGARIAGCVEAAKESLRLPVTIGTPLGISSVIDRAYEPSLSTAVGLVLWGRTMRGGAGGNKSVAGFLSKLKVFGKVADGVKKIFSSLRP